MSDLVFAADDFSRLKEHLLNGEAESCAVIFATETRTSDDRVRMLVREIELPTAADYTRRGLLEAELRPELVARVSKRARRADQSLIFCHSHPGTEPPQFSPIDDRGEQALAQLLGHRNAGHQHGALVLSVGGLNARRLATEESIRVVILGTERQIIFEPTASDDEAAESFDRQVRAFGSEGQKVLRSLRVGVVGVGGTGSIVVEQLAHLGVRNFVLIDPDVLEASNLNRVVGATPGDVGTPKVDLAARMITAISGDANVARYAEDVIYARTARRLLDADLIFGCTDSHGSRAVLQQLAYQYLIPCIDIGTTIVVADQAIRHVIGRVQMLAPGLGCFNCNRLLDPEQVRRDMMTSFERKADPYIQGAHVPAPAVISLNGTMCSLAVTMMLAAFAGIPSPARYILYDARRSSLRSVGSVRDPKCFICSPSGAFARGDAWELMARQD
jgi:molybdopterin/thiamine biosynthesis adenylyltransferase